MSDTPPTSAPEFSRVIRVKQLPGDTVTLTADAGERAALAERFGLAGIDRLEARVDLVADGKKIAARGTLDAAIQQVCAVSGEAFPARLEEDIALVFVPIAKAKPTQEDDEIEIELSSGELDEIDYAGESFDLGEALAQTLGLAIDPYAEGPEAETARREAGITSDEDKRGPLADMLSALKKGE